MRSMLGDVVVFNSLLQHRGQPVALANLERRLAGQASSHRIVLSINFGRNNAFSDMWERAFAMRNAIVNCASAGSRCSCAAAGCRLCRGRFTAHCSSRVVANDLRRKPVRPPMAGDPVPGPQWWL